MSTSGSAGLWALLPASLRAALIVGLITSVSAAGLLFKTPGSTVAPGDIAGGEDLAPRLGSGLNGASPTPTPSAGADSRSQAVLSAPEDDPESEVGTEVREGFPTFGRYIYEVEGYESATAFGRRDLPSEMTMTVDRNAPPDDPDVPPLASNEVYFDLFFSEEHTEREIVAYGRDGVAFTHESMDAVFGPVDPSTEATYDPPILQVPSTFKKSAETEGSSTATAADGTQRRIEDWTVTVEGTDELAVFGKKTKTWIVVVERQTQTGSGEDVEHTRRFWFDPSRAIWVKWEETMTSPQDVGPGDFEYRMDYTATLKRAEPISS